MWLPSIGSDLQEMARLKFFFQPSDHREISDEDCSRVVAIIVDLHALDSALLDRCARLRVVATNCIGVNHIDCDRAARLGISVCNAPDYCVEEVADSALSHILNLFRQTAFLHGRLQRGDSLYDTEKLAAAANGCCRIRGRTLGLVGLGNIGIAVVQRARAFGFKVVFYDPLVKDGICKAVGDVERVRTLEELVQRSDCVSLHCPLGPKTRHMIDEPLLRRFKHGAFLVNVSRGGLVDERALARALREGWIAGAALDVHEKEPFTFEGSVFDGVPNLICTPHCAWYSPESFRESWMQAFQCVAFALRGEDPAGLCHCVNRDKLNERACQTRWKTK